MEYNELMRRIEIACDEYHENMDWFKERTKRLSVE